MYEINNIIGCDLNIELGVKGILGLLIRNALSQTMMHYRKQCTGIYPIYLQYSLMH